MSEDQLVRHGAPTLAGIKTGSLFNCEYTSKADLLRQAAAYDRMLAPRGLRLITLRFMKSRALLYLYRPRSLARDLTDPEARSLLREAGYTDLSLGGCLRELKSRLRADRDFPHEIGLFLGYPTEDVRGFIRTGGKNCKCAGMWKVYGDEEAAKRRFTAYAKCTETYCRRCAGGMPLVRLAVEI